MPARAGLFPRHLDATRDQKYRAVLLAWSDIRTRHALERDEHGRYWRAQQA
jgi:hypothetical protein